MKQVLLTDKAKFDITEIKNFMAKQNSNASIDFIETLKKFFSMLSEYPNVGVHKQEIKEKSVLIYTIRKKYTIVYRIKNDSIEILRILYKYQNIFAIL